MTANIISALIIIRACVFVYQNTQIKMLSTMKSRISRFGGQLYLLNVQLITLPRLTGANVLQSAISDLSGLITYIVIHIQYSINSNRGVMVCVLVSSAVDHGFEPRQGQTKDYKISICYFSDKYAALRINSKNVLIRNQHNVSDSGDMSTRGLLFQ